MRLALTSSIIAGATAVLLISICSGCKQIASESDEKAIRNAKGEDTGKDNFAQTPSTVIGAVKSSEGHYTVVSCRDIDTFRQLNDTVKKKAMSESDITDFIYKEFPACNFSFREQDPKIKKPVFMDGKDISLLKSICQDPVCTLRNNDLCVSILNDVFGDIEVDYVRMKSNPKDYLIYHNVARVRKVVNECFSGYLQLKAENRK